MASTLKERLRDIFAQTGPSEEWDVRHLLRELRPTSREELFKTLTGLVISGELNAVYRVISPETKVGIAEFTYDQDLPAKVFDNTAGAYVLVDFSTNVEVIYRPR